MLDPLILEELKKEQINKEKLTSTITNIITHTIYIFLLIALATTMNGQNTYYQKEQMERLINVSLYFNNLVHKIILLVSHLLN